MSERAAAQAFPREADDDFAIVIATAPATARQRRTALGIVIVLLAAALIIAPFAAIRVARIDVFVPVLRTVLSVADIITATLLFSQYSIQPQRSLLALASGYVSSSAFAFLQTLSFPGGICSGRADRGSVQHSGLVLRLLADHLSVIGPGLRAAETDRKPPRSPRHQPRAQSA